MAEENQSEALETAIMEVADAAWTRADVEDLIAAFAERTGTPGLALDEDGVARMSVDDEIDIALIHYAHFQGLVAASPMPPEVRGDDVVLRALLRANMSWSETKGGTFGMMPQGNVPVLCRLIPFVSMDAEALGVHLAEFIGLVREWHAEIYTYLDSAEDKRKEAARPELPGMRV